MIQSQSQKSFGIVSWNAILGSLAWKTQVLRRPENRGALFCVPIWQCLRTRLLFFTQDGIDLEINLASLVVSFNDACRLYWFPIERFISKPGASFVYFMTSSVPVVGKDALWDIIMSCENGHFTFDYWWGVGKSEMDRKKILNFVYCFLTFPR